MQAVTIVQITPIELEDIIKRSVNDVLISKANEPANQSDQWMGINELIDYIPDKPARPTIYKWVQTGKIPFHKGGKKLRFLKSQIDSWLKQDGFTPSAPTPPRSSRNRTASAV